MKTRTDRLSPGRLPAACLVFWSCCVASQPATHDLDWIDTAILEAGDVDLRMNKSGRITFVDAAVIIDAPLKAIWDILVACEIAPEYVPNVVACQSIDIIDNGASELFIQTVKPAFFVPSFEHVFRMDYTPYETIVVRRVSGPIKKLESAWNLDKRTDGRVLLSYSLELDPGIPIPRMFVRATLRRDLPTVLSAIRTRSETSAQSINPSIGR